MSWFLAFAGFAALVILHEAGHFAAAKAVGMRVERFSLFFPPLLLRKKIGETEYAIGALPIGGYVKITGMNPDQELPEDVRDRAYHAQPVWKRVVVIAAGPGVNLVLAFVLLLVFFWQIGPRDFAVDRIQKGFPAAETLKRGDVLVSVDGHGGDRQRLSNLIAAHRCAERPPKPRCRATTPARLVVERDGRRMRLAITPIYDPQVERTRIGFVYGDTGPREPLPIGDAAGESVDRFWIVTRETVKLPLRLFDSERRKEIGSAVGGYEVTRQTILSRTGDVVGVLAIISLSLAIINLFPFLPLDGGHIFWALVEKVRRRPVTLATMERASAFGFLLVIGFFLIGLSNDIDRLSGEGFQVR
ncbi:MAG TPA: site-2 protease family protein [Thermoleophilaceae bacterium]